MRCSLNSLDNFANNLRLPLWDKASAEFYFAKSRELLSKPFPSPQVPYNSCRDLNDDSNINLHDSYSNLESRLQNLRIETALFEPSKHHNRTLTKSECMARKTYSSNHQKRLGHNRPFYSDPLTPPHNSYQSSRAFYDNHRDLFPFNDYRNPFTPNINRDDDVFVYDNYSYSHDNGKFLENNVNVIDDLPPTFSFTNSQDSVQKKTGKTVRERNRRRQSYNPQAYADTSSSDSDCMSLGSVDLDWRRRRRLRRMSTSNSSIRSELTNQARLGVQFLKPEILAANNLKGKSPPPSSSLLSGLSPTTAARKRQSDSLSDSTT